jgi:hypothetical protein
MNLARAGVILVIAAAGLLATSSVASADEPAPGWWNAHTATQQQAVTDYLAANSPQPPGAPPYSGAGAALAQEMPDVSTLAPDTAYAVIDGVAPKLGLGKRLIEIVKTGTIAGVLIELNRYVWLKDGKMLVELFHQDEPHEIQADDPNVYPIRFIPVDKGETVFSSVIAPEPGYAERSHYNAPTTIDPNPGGPCHWGYNWDGIDDRILLSHDQCTPDYGHTWLNYDTFVWFSPLRNWFNGVHVYQPGVDPTPTITAPAPTAPTGWETSVGAVLDGRGSDLVRTMVDDFLVDQMTDEVIANPANQGLFPDDTPESRKTKVKVAMRTCVERATASGIAGAIGECTDLPVFVSGRDVGEATDHDILAQRDHPAWFKLKYRVVGDNDRWYQNYPPTRSADPDAKCKGTFIPGAQGNTACDEYPFWITEQGGDHPQPNRPDLEIIDFNQNSAQGNWLKIFKNACELEARLAAPPAFGEGNFLVVPTPPGSGEPTFWLCNRKLSS